MPDKKKDVQKALDELDDQVVSLVGTFVKRRKAHYEKAASALHNNLKKDTRRYAEIRRGLPGVSDKVLAQQLREMETDGLLHRIAHRAARVGVPSLIEQLYQVGTHPPHFSYFSRVSAERLLGSVGLRVIDRASDRDFDATDMGDRVQFLARLGGLGSMLGSLLGIGLEAAVTLLAQEDSLTLFAVPLTSAA